MSSSSLVPQGQLDWVALSRYSMTSTLDIAARIMHGGVDTCTLLVGRAVCTSFVFPPNGQNTLHNSLSQLKIISSLHKVLWFGFGIKTIAHLLSETEHGALCVALSAALTIPYTSFDAAQVWHQYCILKGTPTDFWPSIHQWKCLVESCSGALQHSNFAYHYDEFARMLAPRPSTNLPASPLEVARALATLGDLSAKKVASAIFVGNAECAWLAAVAKCLLCLPIEITDQNGDRIYYWAQHGQDQAQAIFRPHFPGSETRWSSTSLVQRVCVISSGRELLHERIDFITSAIRHRSNWNSILVDSFPNWQHFVESPAAKSFINLLQSVAARSEAHFTSAEQAGGADLPWWLKWDIDKTILFHPRRTGQQLLQFARRTFQELPGLSSLEALSFTSSAEIDARLKESLQQITDHCKCLHCQKIRRGSGIHDSSLDPGFSCLPRLAMTIIRLILILSPTIIYQSIPPSPAAFRQIYNYTVETQISSRGQIIPRNGVELILYLFTGQLASRIAGVNDRNPVGASIGGVCVFFSLLKDPNQSPLDAMEFEIIPGQIKHRERTYKTIVDMETIDGEKETCRKLLLQRLSAGTLKEEEARMDLVVEETKDKDLLCVSYQAVLATDFTVDIGIAELQERLRCSIAFDPCLSQGCPDSMQRNGLVQHWAVATQSPPVCVSVAEFEGFLTDPRNRWLFLDWNAWQWQSKKTQPSVLHLDLDVYQGSNEMIFLFLFLISKERNSTQSIGKMYGFSLLVVPSNVNCLIHHALFNSVLSSSKDSDKQIQISLRRQCLGLKQPGHPLVFDLFTAAEQKTVRSHSGLWKLLGRKTSGD